MKISKLYCNKPSIFEPIYFNIGLDAVKSEIPDEYADLLNVILAEIVRHKDEKSDSHNLGKTTLSYLLDFMFLKEININTSRHFLHINENLFNDFVFYLEILLNSGEFLTVRRSVRDNTKIFFKKHNESRQNYTELPDEDWDVKGIAIQKARQLFDSYLNLSVIMPWGYRMGISYFLRTQQDYNDPFQISKFNNSDHIAWKPYIAQVLGFDGKIIQEKYELDDQIEEKETEKKKKQRELSFNENEFIKLRSIIELEKDELDSIEKNLDSFSFKDEEKKINKELVDNIEGEISSINSRTFDISYDIKKIKNSLNEKFSFNLNEIRKIYEEVNIFFPEETLKSYRDLLKFNKKISSERNVALEKRLTELQEEYSSLQIKLDELDNKRSELLKVLGNDDSFEKYKALQKQFSKKRADLINLEHQYKRLKEIIELSNEIKQLIKKRDAKIEKMRKFVDNPPKIHATIKKDFSNLVKEVLNSKGVLYADLNKNGNLDFHIEILKGESSFDLKTSQTEGTSYKKLLCALFDLAILRTYASNNFYHFVYHDGIFEGLDKRKKVLLLKIIKETCQKYNVQYILSVIDTDLPRDENDNKIYFPDDDIIVKLNDTGDKGRLFKMEKF